MSEPRLIFAIETEGDAGKTRFAATQHPDGRVLLSYDVGETMIAGARLTAEQALVLAIELLDAADLAHVAKLAERMPE